MKHLATVTEALRVEGRGIIVLGTLTHSQTNLRTGDEIQVRSKNGSVFTAKIKVFAIPRPKFDMFDALLDTGDGEPEIEKGDELWVIS